MSKKDKKRFRIGQAVPSIYDATHTFVIDKSIVPERILPREGLKSLVDAKRAAAPWNTGKSCNVYPAER